jgi:hypothetical protein
VDEKQQALRWCKVSRPLGIFTVYRKAVNIGHSWFGCSTASDGELEAHLTLLHGVSIVSSGLKAYKSAPAISCLANVSLILQQRSVLTLENIDNILN